MRNNTQWKSQVEKTESTDSEILVREPAILEQVNNRIYFYAEIDRPNVLRLNRTLREQANNLLYTAKIEERGSVSPIFLHISSFGGSIFYGLAAMDEVINCGVEVVTMVDGCCASAATFLSVVGSKRHINRHAFMLIHQLSSFMWGKYSDFQDEMKNLDKLMDTIRSIYQEYTDVPMDKLNEILDHDIILSTKENFTHSSALNHIS